MSYFLEIEVRHTSNGLVLTQHKYIQDLLSITNMLTSKGVLTPMLPSEKLLLDGGEKLSHEDTTRYWSVISALQYLSLIRPDIFFCVNRVCQFMSSRLLYIGRRSNEFSVIYMTLLIWACVLQSPALICLVPSWMLIGVRILMTVEALEAMRSSLVAILSPRVLENNRQFLVLLRRSNTRRLLMPLSN